MTYNSKQNKPAPTEPPRRRRRLKRGPLLALIGLLLLGNLVWPIAWWMREEPAPAALTGETVASVGEAKIAQAAWMDALEKRYGKEVLTDLVNREVMKQAAAEYRIQVTDAEVELALALLRSTAEATDSALHSMGEAELKESVRARLVLEKVLTRDIVISDAAVRESYEANRALYNIPTTYRASGIFLASDAAARQALGELEDGSSFYALAREKSLDAATSALGGDLGFLALDQKTVDPALKTALETMKTGEIKGPVALADGRFAVVKLEEVAEGRSFSFDQVKEQVRRELALAQLPQSATPEAFWGRFQVDWVYGK